MTSTHDRPILQNLTHTTEVWRPEGGSPYAMREMPAAGKKEKKRALGVSLSEILQTCNTILLNTLLSGEQDGLHLDFEHVRDLIGEWISARAATASYDYAAAGCPPRRFSVGQENHDGFATWKAFMSDLSEDQ